MYDPSDSLDLAIREWATQLRGPGSGGEPLHQRGISGGNKKRAPAAGRWGTTDELLVEVDDGDETEGGASAKSLILNNASMVCILLILWTVI